MARNPCVVPYTFVTRVASITPAPLEPYGHYRMNSEMPSKSLQVMYAQVKFMALSVLPLEPEEQR